STTSSSKRRARRWSSRSATRTASQRRAATPSAAPAAAAASSSSSTTPAYAYEGSFTLSSAGERRAFQTLPDINTTVDPPSDGDGETVILTDEIGGTTSAPAPAASSRSTLRRDRLPPAPQRISTTGAHVPYTTGTDEPAPGTISDVNFTLEDVGRSSTELDLDAMHEAFAEHFGMDAHAQEGHGSFTFTA
ncbi:unnamed protein product, partial [Amoebophrya sp. A120]